MPECRCSTRNIQGRRGEVMELGHCDKHFVKNTRKKEKSLREIFWRFFSFEWKIWPSDRHNQSLSFQHQDTFFNFQKLQERPPALSSLATRLWVRFNIHQYPWISLNIFENYLINCSAYPRALNMHDHLTCSKGFWRCLQFKMSPGSEYGTVAYAVVTQSSEYVWLWLHTSQ